MSAKYKKIYEELKEAINDGEYGPGAKLPDELSLCQIYDCSRMTVKKALDLLVQEGEIFRKQGQGSFVLNKQMVNDPYQIEEIPVGGFDRARSHLAKSRILEFKLSFASSDVAQALHLKENDPVYDILRLRLYDGEPTVIEHTFMPVNLIPGINEDVLNHSIYHYIEHDLNLKIASAQQTNRADVSNDLDHEVLGLSDIERTILEDILSFVSTFLIVSIIIVLFTSFVFKPALIQGKSMYPNFQNGERGLSNVIGVAMDGISRGDIVLAKTTTEKGEPATVIKRVIALPGETIECKDEQVYINGEALDESAYLDNDYAKDWLAKNGYFNYNFDPVTLKEDEYFLMGDNRPISLDSRDSGPYKKSQILAKDFLVLYPFEEFGYYS